MAKKENINIANTNKELKYASFSFRMLASIIDTLLSSIILYPVFAIISNNVIPPEIREKMESNDLQNLPPDQVIDLFSHQLASFTLQNLIISIIIIILWMRYLATPGKMLLKMKIVDAKTGGHPTNRQLIIRYLGYIISILPFGLGFIWIYYDKKCQGWHDKLAGTVVIRG